MHNTKEISTNIEGFKKSLQKRYLALNVDVLLELDENTGEGTLVHSYAVAGGDLKNHINYLD